MKSRIAIFFKTFFVVLGIFTLVKALIEGNWITLIAFFGVVIFVYIRK